MNADNKDDLETREPGRPRPMYGLYMILLAGLAFAVIRLFVWMLRQDGSITEENGNALVLVAMPIAFFVIAWIGQEDRY